MESSLPSNLSRAGQIGQRAADSAPSSWIDAVEESQTLSKEKSLEMRRGIMAQPQERKPEPPTEFQLYVQTTTGHSLPVYGAHLFADQRTLFGPVANAPAPADLLLSAGDELRIRIWGQVNFSASLRISREGEIYLPKVGTVHVAGLTIGAAQDHLREAMTRIYRNFELTMDLGEIHSIQIYVTGMVRQPGEYTVSALNTLVDAVFACGGPSLSGSMRHVQLKRNGQILTDFDIYELLIKGDKTGDRQLQPGDVLYIPAAGPQVAIFGSVRRPAIYELRGDQSLADLLEAAGGRTAIAAGSSIAIDRIVDHAERHAFAVPDTAEGLAAKIVDGDIVHVDPIASSYRETVTLRGSVANPGHFRWHEGMRLSELIPDRDSLVTRGYWWRRTRLGLPSPEFSPLLDQQLYPNPRPANTARTISSTAARQLATERAQTSEYMNGDNRYENLRDNLDATTDLPEMETQDTFADTRNRDNNLRGSYSDTGNPSPTQKSGDRRVTVPSPGGETDWDYAVIERVDRGTMVTSLIPFDLGKLVLQHDHAQDLPLQAGDVVTIFSQDDIHPPIDRKTKYVQLEGEFVHAGIYSVAPGETLRSLVERAGGLTAKAYLYGAEFTRKSTQELEQQRMNEYADRLERLIQHSVPGVEETSGQGNLQAALSTANQSMVGRLRQMRATGRIVLNISPEGKNVGELPEMALEDGDRLVIPSRPSMIQVIGAVFNQNAFLCANVSKVGEYMRMAGGPTREADRRQIFVLRADGSVVHRESGNSVFDTSSLNSLRLYPGDTIIVPEKVVRASGLRELTAWTQIMSQMSLTAASLNVIK